MNFVLLSWLYAFYFFDYKWAMTNVPLVTRVQHFEGHFAFFAGEIVSLMASPKLPCLAKTSELSLDQVELMQ